MKKMENQSLTSPNLENNNLTELEKVKEIAKQYHDLGWSLLPMNFVKGDDGRIAKKPMVKWKDYQLVPPTLDEIYQWVRNGWFLGIITGKTSGIVIVDDDRIKHGLQPATAIKTTVVAQTKSGGTHYYFKYDRPISNSANAELMIDVRGEGGYCVVPLENGYKWISPPTPENMANMPTLPEQLLTLLQGPKNKSSGKVDISDYEVIGDGERNVTLHKLACSIWNNEKLEEKDKISQIKWLNETRCKDKDSNPNPLPESELNVIINQARNFVTANPKESIPKTSSEPISPPKKLQEVINERQAERHYEIDCPSTGFNTLDKMVKGFVPKHTYVLTGDTNVGKTSLACSFACAVASQDKKVLYLALEPDTGVIEYLASIVNNKRFDELEPGADYDFGDLPIDIYTGEQINSVEKLVTAVENGERYDLIIIDHIGYFVSDKNNTNQEQSNVMKKLAGIAKKNQTSVMAIAHIRKPDNRKKNSIPTINDISGSGAFKQDATDVWIVYKKPDPDDETHSTYLNEGKLIVAKSKSGRTGAFDVVFAEMKAGIREMEDFE